MSTVMQPGGWSYPDDTSELTVAQEALNAADERRYARTQLQLIWLKFLHNRAAMAGGAVIIALYLTAIFAGFLAPYDADTRYDAAIYVPPQPIYLVDDGT
jgi:peptide/nickel transport system permease protein